MIFWVVALALAAIVAWFVIRPLLEPAQAMPERSEHAIEVYRDQIAEVARDLERGAITAEQAAAARIEIERRILGTDTARETASGASNTVASNTGKTNWLVPMVIGIALPLIAVAVYLRLGSPHIPDQAFDPEAARTQNPSQAHEFEAMVARLAERLARAPEDLEGWTMLGRSYTFLERYADAAESYGRALALKPGDLDLSAAYGEALTVANNGIVPPRAREAFDTVLRARPDDFRARFYRALAMEQAGQTRMALDGFSDVAKTSPADAPWLPAVRAHIESLAKGLGLDPQPFMPGSAAPAAGGFIPMPSGAESLSGLPAGEVEALMRQRVEALATRLQSDPDDLDGWLRLARSYRVMGDVAKSRGAIAAADRAAEKRGPEARSLVQETARQLDLNE